MADRRSVFWKPEAKPLHLVPGHHVPSPRGLELVEAMQENLREASSLLHEAEARVRSQREARNIYEALEDDNRTVVRATTDEARIALSDVQRARVEVAHWTEYLVWARAEAKKHPAPDSRLPREPGEDDDEAA